MMGMSKNITIEFNDSDTASERWDVFLERLEDGWGMNGWGHCGRCTP